ncbi:MAG: hypothetical protein J7L38_03045 [Thermoproteales archaeon]|nr:hypothetical protein [Thermoproteales archaeon]
MSGYKKELELKELVKLRFGYRCLGTFPILWMLLSSTAIMVTPGVYDFNPFLEKGSRKV